MDDKNIDLGESSNSIIDNSKEERNETQRLDNNNLGGDNKMNDNSVNDSFSNIENEPENEIRNTIINDDINNRREEVRNNYMQNMTNTGNINYNGNPAYQNHNGNPANNNYYNNGNPKPAENQFNQHSNDYSRNPSGNTEAYHMNQNNMNQNHINQNQNAGFKEAKKAKKPQKKMGYFHKAVMSVSLGLCFGLFAGLGIYAVQQVGDILNPEEKQIAVGKNTGSNVNAIEETQSGIKLTDTNSIRVVSSDVSDVVEEVMPAMVSIINNYTATGTTFFGQTYQQEAAASGSGIIIAESDTELLIATNYHVVAEATSLDVTFVDNTQAKAQIKGTDSEMDLAVIAIPLESLSEETKAAIAVATMGDSDSLELGEPVIAIGNALGYGQSVTNGIVSALNREVTLEDGSVGTFIQTNAAINPGNSGGALLSVSGEVIGINSNKIGGSAVEGMGYAIPISAAKPIIAELMLRQTRTKVEAGEIGYMGIYPQTITSQFAQLYNMPQGIYVKGVEEGSAAQEAGMLSGDIIIKFDGESLSSHEDLNNILQYYAAGSTATITVKRPMNGEYKEIDLTITLGSRPKDN